MSLPTHHHTCGKLSAWSRRPLVRVCTMVPTRGPMMARYSWLYGYDSFSIQHSNGHRRQTPAIARCFTFCTTVSPLRRKYMEERRERVIRLSSDSTSFLQNNCIVDYFGEHWQKHVRFSKACYGFFTTRAG